MNSGCIFCGSRKKRSKEHVWPDWMREYFPKMEGQSHNRETHTFRWETALGSKRVKRQGHLSTLKIRAVCEECNSGWMSQLESETKPILKGILQNQPVEITEAKQETLARWITVKTIVGEHAEPDICVTPEADRYLLKSKGIIPNYYAIYLGRHTTTSDTAWLRTSQTIGLSKDGPSPPLGGLKRNTQSIAFLCGPLFLFVFAIRVEGIGASEFFKFSKLSQLFPLHEPIIHWPLAQSLSKSDMSRIAYALEDIKNLPNVHDGGDLP